MISFLIWSYRVALRWWTPRDLREMHGSEIESVFECLLIEARKRGRLAALRSWAVELTHLFRARSVRLHRTTLRAAEAGMRAHVWWGVVSTTASALAASSRRSVAGLSRSPGYALASVATLAVGLGLTSAVHSVASVSVLSELPVVRPDEIAVVRGVVETPNWRGQTAMSAPELVDVAERNHSFADFALFSLGGDATLQGTPSRRLRVSFVSPSYFQVFEARPALGRLFPATSGHLDPVPEVVLAHHTWIREFQGDPSVIGRTVSLSGRTLVVAGVVESSHVGVGRGMEDLDAWIPLAHTSHFLGFDALSSPLTGTFWAVGRLRSGVSFGEAAQDVEEVHAAFGASHELGDPRRAGLLPLREYFFSGVDRPFSAVALGALLVLLVCGANLYALGRLRAQLCRDAFALRAALGASRRRIAAEALGDAGAVLVAGGLAAFVLAQFALVFFEARFAPHLVTFAAARLRPGPFLWVWAGFAVAYAAPAVWRVVGAASGGGGSVPRGSVSGTGGRRARRDSLVVALEAALAVVVLVPTVLVAVSLDRLGDVELGYRPTGLESARVNLIGTDHGDYWGPGRFARDVHRSLETTGGRAGVMGPDMMGQSVTHVRVVPYGLDPTSPRNVVKLQWISVTPGTLETLGIERIAGRDVSWDDVPGGPMALVLNERAARAMWPNESPLGKRLHVSGTKRPVGLVVGVVRDARHIGRAGQHYVAGDAYFAFAQKPTPQVTVLLRPGDGSAPPPTVIRDVVRAVDAHAAPYDPKPVVSVLRREEAPLRVVLVLTSAYAAIAVLMTGIGLASILGHAVRSRRSEWAIRSALGAPSGRLLWMMNRRMLSAVALGLMVGVAVARAVVPVIEGMFFRVSPGDPGAYGAAIAVVCAVVSAAVIPPCIQALRIPVAEPIRNA